MMNSWESIARFVGDYVWKTYIEPRLALYVRYYRATVTKTAENGKITVQRPFDTPVALPYAGSAAGLEEGSQCLVLVFGSMSNAKVVGDINLSNI